MNPCWRWAGAVYAVQAPLRTSGTNWPLARAPGLTRTTSLARTVSPPPLGARFSGREGTRRIPRRGIRTLSAESGPRPRAISGALEMEPLAIEAGRRPLVALDLPLLVEGQRSESTYGLYLSRTAYCAAWRVRLERWIVNLGDTTTGQIRT